MKKKPTISQTMTNSPGGIQAGGDVVIRSDRRLINSIRLRVALDVDTPSATTTERKTDVGLQSAVALFTKDKIRIRFVTDYMVHDQQISPTTRRLTLMYTPETPSQIEGRELSVLESIEILAVNYSEIFRLEKFAQNNEPVIMHTNVTLNGIEIGLTTNRSAGGVLATGQANVDIGQFFRQIPAAYAKAVAR
jgi:hypothetical protein